MKGMRTILLAVLFAGMVSLNFVDVPRHRSLVTVYVSCMILLLFLFGVLQGVVFIQSVREGYNDAERDERIRRGLCLGCGYNLRGNTSEVCPECGRAIKLKL
jgi:hypothetical protein